MFRFYRNFTYKMLVVLLYLKRSGIRFNDAWNAVHLERDNFGDITTERGALGDIIYEAGNDLGDLDEMAREMYQQISQRKDDADLVDTVVRLLGLPNAANVAGKTIDALRKAILVPDELAGLKTKLADLELHCTNCHRPFGTGEMCTIVKNVNGGSPYIYCTSCKTPVSRSCERCQGPHKVMLPNSIMKSIGKLNTCIYCLEEKKNGGVAVAEGPQPENIGRPERQRVAVAEGNRTFAWARDRGRATVPVGEAGIPTGRIEFAQMEADRHMVQLQDDDEAAIHIEPIGR